MTPAITVLFGGSLVAGVGTTYLAGLRLKLEERVFFGAVIGLMLLTALGLVLFLALGMTDGTVWAAFLLMLALGGAGFLAGRSALSGDLADFKARWTRRGPDHPWPLWLLLLVAWSYTLHFFAQAMVVDSQGLHAGYLNIWGDWAAHLSYAGSFAYGDNRPPEFFIDPGHRLGYPFAVDFLAAMVTHLGASLTDSLVLTSSALALAFPGVMYCAGVRLVGDRVAAALAVILFAAMGGTGFIHLLADVDAHGLAALTHPAREYTLNRDLGYQWLDPVLAYLVPQRSILFGLSVILIVMSLLSIAREEERRPWRAHAFVGAIVGLTPVFHAHAYATLVVLSFLWAVSEIGGLKWKTWPPNLWQRSSIPSPGQPAAWSWAAFGLPALILGLPDFLWLLPAGGASSIRLQPGWMAFGATTQVVPLSEVPGWLGDWLRRGLPGLDASSLVTWAGFWLKNTSIFIPLLLLGQFWRGTARGPLQRQFAPLWLWFLAPNLFVFQPWDWDNTKFFVFWALIGSILVAAVVVRIGARGRAAAALATGCVVLLGLSGGIDLYRASDYGQSSYLFTDAKGLQVAAWARTHTDPHATFLVAPEHNQPIASLGGRRIVAGYPGWLYSYGLADWSQRLCDEISMLSDGPGTPQLVGRYHVEYVVLGPQELGGGDEPSCGGRWHADSDYWSAHGQEVYSDGEYRILKVTSAR